MRSEEWRDQGREDQYRICYCHVECCVGKNGKCVCSGLVTLANRHKCATENVCLLLCLASCQHIHCQLITRYCGKKYLHFLVSLAFETLCINVCHNTRGSTINRSLLNQNFVVRLEGRSAVPTRTLLICIIWEIHEVKTRLGLQRCTLGWAGLGWAGVTIHLQCLHPCQK